MSNHLFSNRPHYFRLKGEEYVLYPETMSAAKIGALQHQPDTIETPHTLLSRTDMPIGTIVLLLTQVCNLRCTYCYGDEGRFGSTGVMSQSTALSAIDWLFSNSGPQKLLRIGFLGGEPFLNFDVLKTAVLYAEECGAAAGKQIHFYTTTNGTLFDDDKIAFLRDHSVSVQVSLDGPKAVHDANRPFANGQGSYDSVVKGVRALLKKIPDANAHAVVTLGTDPRDIRTALEEIGFTDHSVLPATGSLFGSHSACAGTDTSDQNTTSVPTTEDPLEAIFETLEDEATAWFCAIRSRDTSRLQHLMRTTSIAAGLRAILYDIKCRFPCGAGLGLVGIGVNGDIYPCQRFVGDPQYRLGNITKGAPHGRDAFTDSHLIKSSDCASCFARYYCAGGCKHDNVTATGDMFTPSPETCRFRRRQLEVSAYVVANLDTEDRAFAARTEALPPKPCSLDF